MKLNPNLNVYDPEKNCLWEIGQEGGRTRPINKEVLFQNLLEVVKVFSDFGIKCWLSHGTMLGVYRDGDFISYDDDADVGADISTSKRRLEAEEELRKRGFFVPPIGDKTKPVDKRINMPYSDTVAIRDGEKVEVWWFQKEGDTYIYDIHRQPPCLHHNEKYYDILSEINFKGHIFPIPSYIEEWLKMMYGDSWNIPQEGRKYNNS
jgi:hypothetical protein